MSAERSRSIIIYADNTACVDGKFVRRATAASIMLLFSISEQRPGCDQPEHIRRGDVHLIVYPNLAKSSAERIRNGMRRSEVIARNKAERASIRARIADDVAILVEQGLSLHDASKAIAARYNYAPESVTMIARSRVL